MILEINHIEENKKKLIEKLKSVDNVLIILFENRVEDIAEMLKKKTNFFVLDSDRLPKTNFINVIPTNPESLIILERDIELVLRLKYIKNIIIDSLSYLIVMHGFEKTLSFIKKLKEICRKYNVEACLFLHEELHSPREIEKLKYVCIYV